MTITEFATLCAMYIGAAFFLGWAFVLGGFAAIRLLAALNNFDVKKLSIIAQRVDRP